MEAAAPTLLNPTTGSSASCVEHVPMFSIDTVPSPRRFHGDASDVSPADEPTESSERAAGNPREAATGAAAAIVRGPKDSTTLATGQSASEALRQQGGPVSAAVLDKLSIEMNDFEAGSQSSK